MRRAVFQGVSYLLLGETDGALCTELQFRSGTEAFAYLMPNGDVMRHLEIIGTANDVVLGDAVYPPSYHFPPTAN